MMSNDFTHSSASASPGSVVSAKTDNLALAMQEVLTVTARLRSGRRQATDAETFRRQITAALKAAEQQARDLGYSGEDIRLAVFAVVAFIDESILNLRSPVFSDWARKPLQEEIFGKHVAGEAFFENLDQILARRDSDTTADLLEIYELCLLLGYLGRYSLFGKGEVRAKIGEIDDKIRRIRKSRADLSPHWRLPPGQAEAAHDVWMFRLSAACGACAILALTLYIGYSLSLEGGVTSVEDLAGQARPAATAVEPADQ